MRQVDDEDNGIKFVVLVEVMRELVPVVWPETGTRIDRGGDAQGVNRIEIENARRNIFVRPLIFVGIYPCQVKSGLVAQIPGRPESSHRVFVTTVAGTRRVDVFNKP